MYEKRRTGAERTRVSVIGLGTVGLPTASYIKARGLDVVGYDVAQEKTTAANAVGIPTVDGWDDLGDCDAYVICVSTGWDDNRLDLSALEDVAKRLRKQAQPEELISIESTVIPGTCRKLFRGSSSDGVRVAHVPHRFWAGDPVNRGVRQPRVLGAIDGPSLKAGLSLYSEELDIPLHVVETIEVAEMSKVTENAYRFVELAFAEELRMICDAAGLDFEHVRAACNTKWNVALLQARDGIQGHCLPKDVRSLAYLAGNARELLAAAISIDERYKKWVAEKKRT